MGFNYPKMIAMERRGIINRENDDPLHYIPYREYLQTKYWQSVKAAVLERDKNKCLLCGFEDRQKRLVTAHHRVYHYRGIASAWHKEVQCCITICHRCHGKISEHQPWIKIKNPKKAFKKALAAERNISLSPKAGRPMKTVKDKRTGLPIIRLRHQVN